MPDIANFAQFTLNVDGLSSPVSVARFEGTEAVSELFQIEIMLTSDDKDIVIADVVGKNALLTIQPNEGEPRHFHGIVSRFRHVEDGKKISVYHATLVPTFWRLRHRHDSRIFQEMTVPDILEKVLQGAGLSGSDYRLSLSGSHPAREYCVQYRESDFAFVSRLMEEEGIYYFFEHSDSGHVLVLADTKDVPAPIASPDSLTFRPTLGAMAHSESVSRFSSSEEVQPGKVSLTDFNFKKPGLSLLKSEAASLDTDLEVYDYPGEYDLPGDGGALAQIRLEEWQARRVVADGESGCIRFTPGFVFTLTDHTRDAENRAYLHHARPPPRRPAPDDGGPGLRGAGLLQHLPVPAERRALSPRATHAAPHDQGRADGHRHRPRRGGGAHRRARPREGPVPLGPSRQEGRLELLLDPRQPDLGRRGLRRDVDPAHRTRGDRRLHRGRSRPPDHRGRVYHGANVPPYPLPGEKTKSTIKSDSSIGGGGSNEIRFEDKKGSEEVYLHGQKDWNIKIENDKNQLVGHDETKEVVHDETYKIGNDQALEVGHDRDKVVKHDQSEEIGNDKKIKVGNNHVERIGNSETLTIGSTANRDVGSDQTVSIGGNNTINISGSLMETVKVARELVVGAVSSETIGGAASVAVGGIRTVAVGINQSTTIGKSMSVSVGKDATEEVGNEKKVTVAKKLTMTVGSGSVTIEKNGNITVVGKDITIKGDGKINVQGKSKVTVKSDGPVNVEASGKVKVKGSSVDMN